VFANPAPGHSQEEVLGYVSSLADDLPNRLPRGVQRSQPGFEDSFTSLWFALIMGILVAYMVLASQFNSFRHPVTVLTILPLAAAGPPSPCGPPDKTLNIFSMIGLLLLMGIVKKNSIILVDYANRMRATGLPALEACSPPVRSGCARS